MPASQRIPVLLLLLITGILTTPSQANEQALTPATLQSGGLLLGMSAGYETASLLNTDVNIVVNGLVARVSVMQEFENTGSEWVEGIYVFPLPDKAAVDHMRLYVGDRVIEGEVRETAEARQEYEQAKAEGRKTSLVEQQRANLFTTSVANIAPGEKVIVEIEYLEDLDYDSDEFSLRYPMTLTPRYIPGPQVEDASLITPPMVAASRGHRISLRATVNAGMPLELIASRYHPVHIGEVNGRYSVVLAGGRAAMDHDFELRWRPVPAAAPRALAFQETIGGQPHYLLMVMPPAAELVTAAAMPRELIFIIDTSGSMHGVSLTQAKAALQRGLLRLAANDTFNVIEFNSSMNPLFPVSVAADTARVKIASDFVGRLQSRGGTRMYPALAFALQTLPGEAMLRQVIFITDGAVGNEEELYRLIENRLGATRLFTVGIGSAPNSWFMRKSAEAGRGTFTTISALDEVGEKMDVLLRKLENPRVTDIEVRWPASVGIDAYPATVPDLYLGEPVTVKARASGEVRPHDAVSIAGNSLAGAWHERLPLTGHRESAGIGALWARARIGELLDRLRRGGSEDETRAAVVETALAHHLVSKYTSLVAVDKTPVRPAGAGLDSEHIANLVARGQGNAAVLGWPGTATNAERWRRNGTVLLLLALAVMAARRRRNPLASYS